VVCAAARLARYPTRNEGVRHSKWDPMSLKRVIQKIQLGKGAGATLFIMVKSLPKSALVETQVMLHTGREEVSEDGEIPRRCVSQFGSGG
jgi:hypothetical protein